MIPLSRAYLCLDDDTVFDGLWRDGQPRWCPRCAGRNVVPIARWIDRPRIITPREVEALKAPR